MSYLRRLLGREERVLLTTHQHWTAFLGRTWHLLVLFLLAAAIAVFLNMELRAMAEQRDVGRDLLRQESLLRIAIVVVLLIYPVIALLYRYLEWRAEQYVVTNLRVIQLRGILSKRVLDSSLEKVNDVMLEQSLLGRMLGYGNVEILTASELAVNKFVRVSGPLAFKAAMLNAKHELEGTARGGRDDSAKLIAELAELRDQGILTEEEFQAKKGKLLAEL